MELFSFESYVDWYKIAWLSSPLRAHLQRLAVTTGVDNVRTVIRFTLIVSALLLLFGLGLYVQHMSEVHDWLRQFGRRQLPADEILVTQRTTAVLPGLDGTVKVHVDDIKRGKTADITIIGPDSVTLATNKGARVGDRIEFTHDGKKYEIDIIQYVDRIGPGDSATFRIIPLQPEATRANPEPTVPPMEKKVKGDTNE